jgi:DNA-binding transcriptional MerR regulator
MKKTLQTQEVLGFVPQKLFYKIGEAGRLVGVEASVLRYWESEFPFLSPRKGRAGQRIYSAEDIGVLLLIRKLLYEDRYTIDGARKKLRSMLPLHDNKAVEEEAPSNNPSREEVLDMVKQRLRRMLEAL